MPENEKLSLGSGKHCIVGLQLCDDAPIEGRCHGGAVYLDLGKWPSSAHVAMSVEHGRILHKILGEILPPAEPEASEAEIASALDFGKPADQHLRTGISADEFG